MDLLPEWPGSYSTLGVFYYQTGQIEKAREVLSRFKGSNAGGLDISRIEEALAKAPAKCPLAVNQPMPMAGPPATASICAVRSRTGLSEVRDKLDEAEDYRPRTDRRLAALAALCFRQRIVSHMPRTSPHKLRSRQDAPIPVRYTDIRKTAGITFLRTPRKRKKSIIWRPWAPASPGSTTTRTA